MSRYIFHALAALPLFTASIALNAQVKPLKENLLLLLDKLPPACTSLDEAKAKCANADGACGTGTITASFTQVYEAKATERITGVAGMSASQQALMEKMSDPAFQAEMQKMTPEQLMALSTQLQMGALPNSGIPKPEETAMAEEFERINLGVSEFSMRIPLSMHSYGAAMRSAGRPSKRPVGRR